MATLQEMRERAATRAQEVRDLVTANNGKWSADHQAEYDAKTAEIEDLRAQIDRQQAADQLLNDGKFADDAARAISAAAPAGKKGDKFVTLYDKWLRGGDEAMTAQDWTDIRNTMSTTTGSEGGYTVPSLISGNLIDAMKAYGAMRYLADSIRTSDGRALSFPTADGTAEVGEIIAQNTTATAADTAFGTVSLNVFKYSSKIVAVPFELLQDSNIDVESLVRKRIAQRLGRIGNQHFTTGTGTTQPDGIIPRATVGKTGTTGQTTTIIFDDVIDLIHSVDPAYRTASCKFMTNDSLIKVLRKLKDSQNMPIWLPGRVNGISSGQGLDAGYSGETGPGVFDTLLGYPLVINNDVATPAANAVTMAFGDFTKYVIRDAMDVQMFRFTDSAYTKLGQVGFLAWCRMGGNLLNTSAIRTYKHSAT